MSEKVLTGELSETLSGWALMDEIQLSIEPRTREGDERKFLEECIATNGSLRSTWKLLGEIVAEKWRLRSYNIKGGIYLETCDEKGKVLALTHLYDLS